MAQKAIREADGKRMMARLLANYMEGGFELVDRYVTVGPDTDLAKLPKQYRWLTRERLVVKPDQLLKRRGKSNLLLLDADWKGVQKWLQEHRNKMMKVGRTNGRLEYFIVEPFVPHAPGDEYYVAITSTRQGDTLLFHHEGGVEVGDVDAKALRLEIPVGKFPAPAEVERELMGQVPVARRSLLSGFVAGLFKFYAELNFAYLEINPLVVVGDRAVPLDLAAKLDDTAHFTSGKLWGDIEFPAPFGRLRTKEEAYIDSLDEKTGASLKLTVLNPEGRVWTMVAGGGASVIYADTITDLGFMGELANYGEYSGDPNEEFTYLYARTILDLMTRKAHPQGKYLFIGGGIANFTDVAKTFTGIIRALREYADKIRRQKMKIYVRRGGPNYQEGLRRMKALRDELGLPIEEVHGPEAPMTRIVSRALKGV